MEFKAVQNSADKLVHWIRSGRLALPDFQREFVWNPGRVVDLIDSVARQWPIGSLLLLSGPQPFGIREIACAPPLSGSNLDYYILDGQQRLTSLYHAICDVSDYCYYVDFNALLNDEEDYIRWEKRATFIKKFPTLHLRASSSIALVKDIWELDSFYNWIEDAPPGQQRAIVTLRERRLGGLQARVYQLMTIELDQDIKLEALARIFETLNRTGVKLNAFDLMVAMLYPVGFHLRDKWEEAKTCYDILTKFDVDPIEILKLVALIIRMVHGKRASKGIRQGDLLELDKTLLQRHWDESVELFAKSLDFASSKLGVRDSEVMPASSMILGLAGWLRKADTDPKDVERWFWSSGFSQRYAQAANTVTVADFDALLAGNLLLQAERLDDPFSAFDESARKNGLALRTMACYLISRGAEDLLTGVRLSESQGIAFREIDAEGILRKLSGETTFSKVVLLDKAVEKRLPKSASIREDIHSDESELRKRLKTQAISYPELQRNMDDFRRNVRREVLGEDNDR